MQKSGEKITENSLILTARQIDLEAWEERAAIMEFDGGMPRAEAENAAAQSICSTRLKNGQ